MSSINPNINKESVSARPAGFSQTPQPTIGQLKVKTDQDATGGKGFSDGIRQKDLDVPKEISASNAQSVAPASDRSRIFIKIPTVLGSESGQTLQDSSRLLSTPSNREQPQKPSKHIHDVQVNSDREQIPTLSPGKTSNDNPEQAVPLKAAKLLGVSQTIAPKAQKVLRYDTNPTSQKTEAGGSLLSKNLDKFHRFLEKSDMTMVKSNFSTTVAERLQNTALNQPTSKKEAKQAVADLKLIHKQEDWSSAAMKKNEKLMKVLNRLADQQNKLEGNVPQKWSAKNIFANKPLYEAIKKSDKYKSHTEKFNLLEFGALALKNENPVQLQKDMKSYFTEETLGALNLYGEQKENLKKVIDGESFDAEAARGALTFIMEGNSEKTGILGFSSWFQETIQPFYQEVFGRPLI